MLNKRTIIIFSTQLPLPISAALLHSTLSFLLLKGIDIFYFFKCAPSYLKIFECMMIPSLWNILFPTFWLANISLCISFSFNISFKRSSLTLILVKFVVVFSYSPFVKLLLLTTWHLSFPTESKFMRTYWDLSYSLLVCLA